MFKQEAVTLTPVDTHWPHQVVARLGHDAPAQLHALGNLALLALPKTGLFCSVRCPGDAILRTYDQAARWRDAGSCVISGFHSPVEKECLRILLRGNQPIIICPARSLEGMRLPTEWKRELDRSRLLLLSQFPENLRRATKDAAQQRNQLVVALADEVFIPHIAPGGQMARLSQLITALEIPLLEL
jgi:predicted Rossmann fold nucleotide-binding protein DprA/Smf involved in DNA uptake